MAAKLVTNILRGWPPKSASIEQQAQRLVGKSTWRDLCLRVPDWRVRLKAAALAASSDEVSFTAELARRCGYEFIAELDGLELEPVTELEHDLAVIGIAGPEQRVGVVCLDPARLVVLEQTYKRQQIFISTWTAMQVVAAQQASLSARTTQQAERVHDLIVSEAKQYGANSVSVDLAGSYSFTSSSGAIGKGQIAPKVIAEYLGYLKLCTTDNSLVGAVEVVEQAAGFELKLRTVGRLVVVVDDDRDYAALLRGVLLQRGFRVVVFNDPKEALAKQGLWASKVSVLVVDQQMPEFSGLDILREIKAELRSSVGIILATSSLDDQLFGAALEHGVQLCFDKSDDVSRLSGYIERYSRFGIES